MAEALARRDGGRFASTVRSVIPDRTGPRWLILGLASALLAFLWFGRNTHEALMGDDLILLKLSREGVFAGDFLHAFSDVAADKWRPLVTATQSLVLRAFDGSYQDWVYLLTLLQWVNVMAATALAWVMSGRRWSVAVVFAVALVTSRFNTYFVWQTFGLMEGMALLATIACIAGARMAWRTGSARWMLAMVLAATAASLCHERYLCLIGFVALVALLTPSALRMTHRFAWACAAVMIGVAQLRREGLPAARGLLRRRGRRRREARAVDDLAVHARGRVGTRGLRPRALTPRRRRRDDARDAAGCADGDLRRVRGGARGRRARHGRARRDCGGLSRGCSASSCWARSCSSRRSASASSRAGSSRRRSCCCWGWHGQPGA